jgi:predicted glycoside hydrolase/deacetylase ChbG (UPF0249 family)
VTRTVALCADDYGLAPPISRGIVELARLGRLSAVSCLVTQPHWPAAAPPLADLPAGVQLGLHFNLTQGEPASAALRTHWPRLPALPSLMLGAALSRLPRAALADEWRAQWQRFVTAVGRSPDFIDGHQHVHHLPGVREVVLEAAQASGVAVRSTGRVGGPGHAFKRWVIERSGGRALRRELAARGIAHNAVLTGVYDFSPRDYRALMRAWLAAVPAEGALLMCHPAQPGASDIDDPIADARVREAAYLASAEFADDLARAGISLGPAWRQRSSAH